MKLHRYVDHQRLHIVGKDHHSYLKVLTNIHHTYLNSVFSVIMGDFNIEMN